MANRIGPTFTAELVAAGVSLDGWSWCPDGTLDFGPPVSAATQNAAQQVLAAHDPTKTLPPVATTYQIALALNVQGTSAAAAYDAALAKAKPSDRMRWGARTDPLPANSPVFVRVCGLASLDPVGLIALAAQQ